MKYLLLALLICAPAAPAWSRAGGGGGGGGGGCFPAGTRITATSGETSIEKLRPGDRVLGYSDGGLVEVEVKNFYSKRDLLLVIKTPKGKLTTTREHPLMTRGGFTEAGKLGKGDFVAVIEDGRRVWTRISSITRGTEAEVYNLEVAPPHTFIADGFVAHNKGGGFGGGGFGGGYYGSSSYDSGYGGGYYSRRRYRSSGPFDYLIIAVAGTLMLVRFLSNREGFSSGSGSGGSCAAKSRIFPPAEYSGRAARTRAIMEGLARSDPDFEPGALESFVSQVFTRVEAAWQARDYSGLGDVMMPDLRAGHTAKVEAMKDRGEINVMEGLKLLSVDFVHVRCPREKEGRAFTALITASACDYVINEQASYGGSSGRDPEPFQEFWTFYQLDGRWALARIDQTSEMDFLNAPNQPETPEGVTASAAQPFAQQPFAAGGAAEAPFASAVPFAAAAPAAAYAPPAPEAPASPWDRQKMEIAATLAFESVYEAWGKNDGSLLKADFVSGEALAKLRKILEARKAEGLSFEFKDLFTRRAEVVLTSPAEKSPLRLDEFTARITATSVRTMFRNGKPLHRDAAPQPFTEYWVFGRQNQDWKLRDILPRMDQEGADNTQDGAPSPVQIEWYWGNS